LNGPDIESTNQQAMVRWEEVTTMKLSIDLQEDAGYLVCTVTGQWATDELKDYIETIHAELMTHGYRRILADMSLVSGPPPEMDRFYMGEYIASVFHGIKTAIVYKKIYANKFFEDTAVNRGALIKVFPDKETALQWLMSD
jgi:hypothetical protein